MKKIVTFAAVLVATATAAYAGDVVVAAPEIDAVSGLAALGVVGAVAAMVWERRRRG